MLKQNICVPIWNHFSSTWFFVSFDFLTLRKNHPFGTVTLKMCETSSRDDWAAPQKNKHPNLTTSQQKNPSYSAMFKELAKRPFSRCLRFLLDAHKVKPVLSTRSAGATSNNKKRRKETKTHSGKSTILMCEHFGSFPKKICPFLRIIIFLNPPTFFFKGFLLQHRIVPISIIILISIIFKGEHKKP